MTLEMHSTLKLLDFFYGRDSQIFAEVRNVVTA